MPDKINPLTKIPFISRVLSFTCENLHQLFKLAHVTSTFEETIYDYQVGKGILYAFDTKPLGQARLANVYSFLQLTKQFNSDPVEAVLHELFRNNSHKVIQRIRELRNGDDVSENELVFFHSSSPADDMKEKFQAASQDEKEDILLSRFSLNDMEMMLYQLKTQFSNRGTNYEVMVIAIKCAKNGLLRMFRALVVDRNAIKNLSVIDNDKVRRVCCCKLSDDILSMKPRGGGKPSSASTSSDSTMRSFRLITEVELLHTEIVNTAIRNKQRNFLKEFYGMFQNNNNDESINNRNTINTADFSRFVSWQGAPPSEVMFDASGGDNGEQTRIDFLMEKQGISEEDNDESTFKMPKSEFACVSQIRMNTSSQHIPIHIAVSENFKEAVLDLAWKGLHSSSKQNDHNSCEDDNNKNNNNNNNNNNNDDEEEEQQRNFPKKQIFLRESLSLDNCSVLELAIKNQDLEMAKFLVEDCKFDINESERLYLYYATNSRMRSNTSRGQSALLSLLSTVGVNNESLVTNASDFQKGVSEKKKKLRADLVDLILKSGSGNSTDLKKRGEFFRQKLVAFRTAYLAQSAPLPAMLKMPLELAGDSCWICKKNYGFLFNRKGTCDWCGQLACSSCKSRGKCDDCVKLSSS